MNSHTDSTPARDEEGYLRDHSQWSPAIAEILADDAGIILRDEHWEILQALRTFHAQFGLSPAMRPLCKYLKETLGAEKSSSIYLLQLFPGSPAKLAARIAGLPKPDNCL